MPTAIDEGMTIMKQMLEDGSAKDGGEAYTLLHKRYPAVVKRAEQERAAQERAQRPAPVRKAPPLDYAQRQALLAKQDFPLTVPPPVSPLETWESRVERMLADNPGMSLDAAARSVMQQDGGAEAYERYRQQQLFGRR